MRLKNVLFRYSTSYIIENSYAKDMLFHKLVVKTTEGVKKMKKSSLVEWQLIQLPEQSPEATVLRLSKSLGIHITLVLECMNNEIDFVTDGGKDKWEDQGAD